MDYELFPLCMLFIPFAVNVWLLIWLIWRFRWNKSLDIYFKKKILLLIIRTCSVSSPFDLALDIQREELLKGKKL